LTASTASFLVESSLVMADALAKKELFHAAQHNDFAAVGELLQRLLTDENSARETVKDLVEAKTKNSLLHYACDNGNLDACKFLLMCDGMADTFLNEINAFGHTPLFYAASSGQLPLVKWLVSNGADIDTDYSDRPEIVPRDGDQGIFTALQIACFKGHESIANFLVECNAELAGTRRNGKTALHLASAENHPTIVKILLEAGADAHACDDQGRTPVDVAPASILPLLLPAEYPDQHDAGEEEAEMEHGGGDDDADDSFTSNDYEQVTLVKNAFGADVGKGFRSANWKERVSAIGDANLCFQSAQSIKSAIKLFDAASVLIERALQDAVSQVVSACCTTLLRSAFGAAMNDKSFHSAQFHNERPSIQRITSALMSRGAGSNEKDASEAVASLLFLICKSADLTRFVTSQITQMFTAVESVGSAALSPSKAVAGDGQSSSVAGVASSWRHQLVGIKVLNAIASQYRLDETTSGIHFAGAVKVSLQGLDNSSVYVRSAAIDLLVQSVLIRCEQSGRLHHALLTSQAILSRL
jgi:ankyrin repeat protein